MAGLVLAIHAFLRVSPSRGYPGHLAKPTSRCPRMTAFGLGSRASRDFKFNCQTATTLQTCVITPVVCGAGAPSCLAFPPPCERACGTPGARRTLGPDANAVFRNAECIRTFGITSKCPTFRLRCFFDLLALCLSERSDHQNYGPTGRDREPQARKPDAFRFGRPSHCPGIFPSQGRPCPCQWQCWRRSVLPEDRRHP